MQHQRSKGFRTGRTVLGFPAFVILIAVPLFVAAALAQSNDFYNYPATPAAPAPNTYRPSQRHIVRGAGRGVALGAVGGAIAGDAGKGAAAGAAMGGYGGSLSPAG